MKSTAAELFDGILVPANTESRFAGDCDGAVLSESDGLSHQVFDIGRRGDVFDPACSGYGGD